jgi:phosphate:Na+ symporter
MVACNDASDLLCLHMNYGFFDVLTLIGALGFFIYGMKVMSDGIQKVAGSKMRQILGAMTSNRFFGVFTGFLITTLVQSSSATTVMVVSFVNAGLLSLVESIGVIMGANIGTTLTAWLISIFGFKVKIATIALPIIAFGFPMLFAKKRRTRSWGEVLIGFALLFMGLDALKNAVPDLGSNPEILEFLSRYTDGGILTVILFVAVGTIITIVVQSSSAAMALTLVMCNEGWVPFDVAAAMILGENIGTTITANLAALVGNVHAKRAARAHLIFNLMGVTWMILAYPLFINGINSYFVDNPSLAGLDKIEYTIDIDSPDQASGIVLDLREKNNEYAEFFSADLIEKEGKTTLVVDFKSSEINRTDEDIDEKILATIPAVFADRNTSSLSTVEYGAEPSAEPMAIPIALSIFHTVFNILNVLLLIWFVPQIARVVTWVLPARGEDDEVFSLDFIGGGLMDTAELSILEAKKEIGKFGDVVQKLYRTLPKMVQPVEDKKFNKYLDRVKKYEDITDRMEYEIATYLTKASEGELSDEGSQRVRAMLSIIADLEIIGDMCYQIAQNLQRRRDTKAYFTPELRQNSELMITKVGTAIDIMQKNLNMEFNKVSLKEARDIEDEIDHLRNQLRAEHLKNIEKGAYKVQSGMFYIDLIHALEKVGDQAYDISETIVTPTN